MTTAQIVVYALGIILSAFRAGPGVLARWRTLRTIVREERAPSAEEWDALDAEIADNARERDEILAGKDLASLHGVTNELHAGDC